jgi:signal transduction histidine kinase/ActR/RegA family two-component response regulator
MQAASHFATKVGESRKMPRTSRIQFPAGQPGSIRIKTSRTGQRPEATPDTSLEIALAGIMNSSQDGVALLSALRNAAGRVVDFVWVRINPAGERILGLKAELLIGQRLLATFADMGRNGVIESFSAAMEACEAPGTVRRCAIAAMDAWIEYSAAPIDDGVAVTFRDVTARYRDEAVLQAALTEAARVEQAKSSFLALVNHELRTPLNGVLCALDLLAGCADADRDLFVNTALNSARDLNRVVGAILHLASLDAGTADIDPVAFDLHDLVEREAALIAPAAAVKNLSVECRIDPAVPRSLTGSPDHIRLILRTLLENAVKFTPSGSVEVSLTACPRYSPGSSTCSCPDMRHSGAMACFSLAVRDTGIGIAPEFHSSLFEAFTQCDSSLNRLHDGCGLGLAICNRLSQQLGGTLTVDSQPEKGSLFRLDLSLPLAPPAVVRRTAQVSAVKKRILLVDPGEASGMVTSLMLSRAGFEVEAVKEGMEALRLAKLERFDAMVIDMQMPDINGVLIVKALRHLAGSIPIIAITGAPNACDDQRGLAAGVTELLVKPFRKNNLLDRLERLVHAEGGR